MTLSTALSDSKGSFSATTAKRLFLGRPGRLRSSPRQTRQCSLAQTFLSRGLSLNLGFRLLVTLGYLGSVVTALLVEMSLNCCSERLICLLTSVHSFVKFAVPFVEIGAVLGTGRRSAWVLIRAKVIVVRITVNDEDVDREEGAEPSKLSRQSFARLTDLPHKEP